MRRSKRYMSKRTSGTFREYLNSRNIDLAYSDESFKNSESSQQSEQMEHKPLIENKTKDALMRKGSMRRSTKSAVTVKCDKNGNNVSDKDVEINSSIESTNNNNETTGSATTKNGSANNNSFLKKYDYDVSKPKNLQFESTTDDWYASASDFEDSDGAVSKSYGYNAVNPVLECVNQVRISSNLFSN